MSEAIKPEIRLGDGLFQQASFVIMVLYPLAYPVCCHVAAALCCRFPSLWTKIVHPWRRRSWRPHSPPSRCPSTPPHTCLCLQTEQRKWVDLSVTHSRRWRRWLTDTLHQGDLPCHGSLDQVWQPGPTSWCTEFIIDFLQMETKCKFRRASAFSLHCPILKGSYAICGNISSRDFLQGNVMVFDVFQSAVRASEVQTERPDAHAHSYDDQQKGQTDPELRTVGHWGWCCWLFICTRKNLDVFYSSENYETWIKQWQHVSPCMPTRGSHTCCKAICFYGVRLQIYKSTKEN